MYLIYVCAIKLFKLLVNRRQTAMAFGPEIFQLRNLYHRVSECVWFNIPLDT